jgi:hypothetical protein
LANRKIVTLRFQAEMDICASMNIEDLQDIINLASKGNTGPAEALFRKPGGRKYLESLVLLLVCNLPYLQEDKEDVFLAFRKVLDKLEYRIRHQQEGQKILSQVYN